MDTGAETGGKGGLRDEALNGTAEQFGITPQNGIWGVILELGAPEGPYTLVALADGRTRLSLSGGMGVLEDHGHERVRAGALRLCELAAEVKDQTASSADFRWAKVEWMRFYLLTDLGPRLAEFPANILGDGRHPFSRLFLLGNDVVTRVRLAAANP